MGNLYEKLKILQFRALSDAKHQNWLRVLIAAIRRRATEAIDVQLQDHVLKQLGIR